MEPQRLVEGIGERYQPVLLAFASVNPSAVARALPAHPVSPYTLASMEQRNGDSPRLIGRAHEFALLCSRLEDAAQGRLAVVMLAGEPGTGKSRLMEEVATWACAAGGTVLRGGSSEAEGMPPYLPF